ncbi:MAG: hypothetical protein JNM77_15165 [Pseudonocardia sp.]|nr:hypothetical protein [Pseudonocardia sp.]
MAAIIRVGNAGTARLCSIIARERGPPTLHFRSAGAIGTGAIQGDPQQHTTFALHRRAVVVPALVLTGDPAVSRVLTRVDRHDYHQALTELPRVAADAVRNPLRRATG